MLSWRPTKKMVVLACKGQRCKVVHFGAKGMEDYLTHQDKRRRANYLTRSAGIRNAAGRLTKNDKWSANYWSRRILWLARD